RRLAYNEEISYLSCGLSKEDIVLLTCTLDRCFVAGLAYFSGVRSLGAAAIRNGLNSVDSHLEVIKRLKPTALVGVPTFLLKLGQFIQSQGIDVRDIGVKRLVCIGEPIRDRNLAFLRIGELLEETWGAKIYSTLASSETVTSFCECTAQRGGHLHPDLGVVEIVNDRGEVLPAGEVGEVVMTPLRMEGMPLLRFRTGDVSFLVDEPCACGRFSPRLGPVLGRKNQMIKFRGTTLYPNSFFAVLDSFPGISEYYVTASSDFDLSDMVSVTVALKDGACTAEMIGEKLQAHLRVRPEVVVANEESVKNQVFAGNSRKPIRFVDKRKSL
ncbi:MAG TPA: AMP-binding protein, partial [Nitrospirota bacterium]